MLLLKLLVFGLALSSAPTFLPAQTSPTPPVTIGEGAQRYAWVSGWLKTPDGKDIGNTHGSIVEDSHGDLYVNSDTDHAISVYSQDGKFLRAFAGDQGEGIHGMCIVIEKDGEFLYHVNHRLHLWRKLKLDGTVVFSKGTPMESGKYDDESKFHPTSVAVVPDGDIYVADGYGTSWVHRFDHAGNYKSSFGGPGAMNCPHGMLYDTRTTPPSLLIADRENHRMLVCDMDGKTKSVVEGMFRRPCSMQSHDGFLAVPDLAGRVTILDANNHLVCHLGDNPDESLRAQNRVPKEKWQDGVFISPHSAHWDSHGNLYVMDWNYLGRVNKLERVRPAADKDGVGYEDTPYLPHSEWRVHDKNRPVPAVVKPGQFLALSAPSDAIVLFDGKDLSKWKSGDKDGQWKVENGYTEVNGTGTIETKAAFGDCQIHLEFCTPAKVEGHSQERGNSGVFLMGRYEVQVLDSFENRTYADGQCGALYGQTPPLVNACRKPGEWQMYDIVFKAPRFDGATLVSPAIATVVLNGVVVQAQTAFIGATRHREVATYAAHEAELPLALQDHGNPMRYRNIWVRRL